ncbi:MAG: imidazole glycerol phosphate synthase subunit HisH [Coriobacteriales bacterium]|nr:imidazole glycerol phosphate synthase subunit HisH [Coriobacteriales bacterium]
MSIKCAIVDYSKGNLRSAQKGLELAGADAFILADAKQIATADAIVLPGVGSFADASASMLANGQMQVIRERVQAGVPFLGICLGLQLLFESGDEGSTKGFAQGLGLLKGSCCRIATTDKQGLKYKVPHVGWNQVHFATDNEDLLNPLFCGIPDGSNFYFTHSYQANPENANNVIATVRHATEFTCAIRHENILATQFHPEKSSHMGLAILRNFVAFVKGI